MNDYFAWTPLIALFFMFGIFSFTKPEEILKVFESRKTVDENVKPSKKQIFVLRIVGGICFALAFAAIIAVVWAIAA